MWSRRVAEAIVQREEANAPQPIPALAEPPVTEEYFSTPAPQIAVVHVDEMPEWWQQAKEAIRPQLSPATFDSFVLALRATDVDGVRTVFAPVPFTLQKLRKDLNADLDRVLANLGYDVVVRLWNESPGMPQEELGQPIS